MHSNNKCRHKNSWYIFTSATQSGIYRQVINNLMKLRYIMVMSHQGTILRWRDPDLINTVPTHFRSVHTTQIRLEVSNLWASRKYGKEIYKAWRVTLWSIVGLIVKQRQYRPCIVETVTSGTMGHVNSLAMSIWISWPSTLCKITYAPYVYKPMEILTIDWHLKEWDLPQIVPGRSKLRICRQCVFSILVIGDSAH